VNDSCVKTMHLGIMDRFHCSSQTVLPNILYSTYVVKNCVCVCVCGGV
jgi:hypothetical protein